MQGGTMDLNDKLSIKNLLFTKAIPNYEIPVPVTGHKTFGCTDCGDKFIFESSLNYHVNRKSVQITYTCRHCNQTKTFYNRCRLLHHIRSHSFRTATINVQDLTVLPVPLDHYKFQQKNTQTVQTNDASKKNTTPQSCYECKTEISTGAPAYKDRASHFMQYTNKVYTCPICLFVLPTVCGLKAHMRFHLRIPPYFCSECGIHLSNKSVQYPYNHDCDGFKMMRVTARLKCPVPSCSLLHPNDFKEHMKQNHLKKVFKCPYCVVACFNETTIEKHLKGHGMELGKALIFHQCEICPGRLVVQPHMDNHLKSHAKALVHACWTCGANFRSTHALIDHLSKKHDEITDTVKDIYKSLTENLENGGETKRIYRVVKRCDQCKRNFTYKCNYNEIPVLPNECPYKCKSTLRADVSTSTSEIQTKMIKCNMCNMKISQNWDVIKKHYAKKHRSHRCLDARLVLDKINIQEYKKKRYKLNNINRRLRSSKNGSEKLENQGQSMSNSNHNCKICDYVGESKEMLETHMITHRDPCMAYQCMECGQSFAVKPSFSKHLLLEHNVSDAEEYIKQNQCYNGDAFEKYHDSSSSNEPLKENQCKICREQFNNPEDLEKHFRIHGMAFLLKNAKT